MSRNRNFSGIIIFLIFILNVQAVVAASYSNNTIPNNRINSINQNDEKLASTSVNISLDHEGITYKRRTHLENAQAHDYLLFYSAIVKLTTHGELAVFINLEINTSYFDDNYTIFLESPIINDYKVRYEGLNNLVWVPITILNIQSQAFRNESELRPFEGGKKLVFRIEQQLIIRETTVFLLALPELFKFDLNDIQLSSLEDFHFEVYYDAFLDVADEFLKIKAKGSPLEKSSDGYGLSGKVRLSDFLSEQVEPYQRVFGIANQSINMIISVPKEQTLTYSTSYGEIFYGEESEKGDINAGTEKNEVSLTMTTGQYIPVDIEISSYVPLLEQFSPLDYVSYSFGAMAGLVAVLRGLPYLFKRRRVGGIHSKLFTAANTGDISDIEEVVQLAAERFKSRKITVREFEDILNEAKVLQSLKKRSKKEEALKGPPKDAFEDILTD